MIHLAAEMPIQEKKITIDIPNIKYTEMVLIRLELSTKFTLGTNN